MSLSLVDEEANDVKKTRKPSDDKNDVKSFDDEVHALNTIRTAVMFMTISKPSSFYLSKVSMIGKIGLLFT